MSQPSKQTITKDILCNISRSKGKRKIKFGQVLEFNKMNIFQNK